MANTLFNTRAYALVRRELFTKGTGAHEKSDSIWFCCPFHGESTPSCKVNTVEGGQTPFGWFYCFGCRTTGPWNQLAEKMNMKKFDREDLKAIDGFAPNIGYRYKRIKSALTEEVEHKNDLSQFDDMIQRNRLIDVAVDWRGISKQTLLDLNCKRLIDRRDGTTHLIIPIYLNGDVKGVVRARWIPSKDKKVPNYLNAENAEKHWAKQYGLLGYDRVKKLKAFKKYGIVFLVEGPRDAMRLLQLGIPALSLLGSTSWSNVKRNCILELEPNLVCSLMDNDKAGRKAGKRLTAAFERRVRFHCFNLPKDKDIGKKLDPMILPESELQTIWNEAKRLAK